MQAKSGQFLSCWFGALDGDPVLTHGIQGIVFVEDFPGFRVGVLRVFDPRTYLELPLGCAIVASESDVETAYIHPVIFLAHPQIQSVRRFVNHGMERPIEKFQPLSRSDSIWTGNSVDSRKELPMQTVGLILGNLGQHM